jgi:hypothetical protein
MAARIIKIYNLPIQIQYARCIFGDGKYLYLFDTDSFALYKISTSAKIISITQFDTALYDLSFTHTGRNFIALVNDGNEWLFYNYSLSGTTIRTYPCPVLDAYNPYLCTVGNYIYFLEQNYTRVYVLDNNFTILKYYELSFAYGATRGITFDGKFFYVCFVSGGTIIKYDTNFNILNIFHLSTVLPNAEGIYWDNSQFYALDNSYLTLVQFRLD